MGKPKKRIKRQGVNRDKHELYEKAVQEPEADVRFFDRVYKRTRGELPSLLKEDFCGTAALAAAWVAHRASNRAIGVDLDRPTLDWGRERNLAPLGDAAKHVTLLEDNVLNVTSPKVDLIAAMNFSYFIFKTRDGLKEYLTAARDSLAKGGMLFMDIFGGSESQELDTEVKELEGYDYHWEQVSYDSITNETLYHIHFEFPDGTWMKKAFVYDWRMWTIREVTDILEEIGFDHVTVYWEGTDADGEGNGVFRPAKHREPEPGWIAYIVAHDDV